MKAESHSARRTQRVLMLEMNLLAEWPQNIEQLRM
jgi:hypothetical protein